MKVRKNIEQTGARLDLPTVKQGVQAAIYVYIYSIYLMYIYI